MLHADYVDGRSTRVRIVTLAVEDSDLVVTGEGVAVRVPFARVQVDERLGRAPRRLHLPGGALCTVRDLHGLERLLSAAGHRHGLVDRLQRHAPAIVVAGVLFIVLAVALYRWALPWAAAVGARHMPPAVARELSAQTMRLLDGSVLLESKLDVDRQATLLDEFHAMRTAEGGHPTSELLFRASPKLGANAFTMPDGTIIILDDLVTSMDDDQEILAVLAHELGHVRGRHGLQRLLQSTSVAALITFYVGDFSTVLAIAPTAVLDARYSQDLEQAADDYAASTLVQNGISPSRLADALEALAKEHPGSHGIGFLSSHPSTDARIRRLRSLGATTLSR